MAIDPEKHRRAAEELRSDPERAASVSRYMWLLTFLGIVGWDARDGEYLNQDILEYLGSATVSFVATITLVAILSFIRTETTK